MSLSCKKRHFYKKNRSRRSWGMNTKRKKTIQKAVHTSTIKTMVPTSIYNFYWNQYIYLKSLSEESDLQNLCLKQTTDCSALIGIWDFLTCDWQIFKNSFVRWLGRKHSHLKFLCPCCQWVKKAQTNSFGLSVPTTVPAFTEWQSTIHWSSPPPKIYGKKPKATTRVTLTSHQKWQAIWLVES